MARRRAKDAAWTASEALEAELDRVGVSFAKAGAADYVRTVSLGGELRLLGPPGLQPRPTWKGSNVDALALFATIPDGAGPEGFWAKFGANGSASDDPG